MSVDVIIRPIAVGDTAGFHAALDAVCRERRYLAFLMAPSLESAAQFVAENVRMGHPQFVAVADGRVVGWCDAIPGAPGRGGEHIGTLGMGLLAEYRGRGIGRRLLEAVIARAREAGLEKIELRVYASNARAIALYRKLGFEDEGCRRRGRLVDGVHDDVVLMGLFLKPHKESA